MAELTWERMGRCARLAWEHGVESFENASRPRSALLTGHLLLGVIRQPECAGGLMLRRLGVDMALTASITEFELLHARPVPDHAERVVDLWGKPHTPEALRAMELSLDEAEQFHSAYPIGTEHILLGLLAIPEGMGCRTMAYFGVDYPKARAARAEIWDLLKLTE